MSQPASASERILLGEITGVHGIKGEIVIRSFTSNPEDIAAYGPLSDEAGTRLYDIDPIRSGPKGVVARIDGVNDRTAAEKLRGIKLYIARSALPPPEDDAFYFNDLVGLETVDADGIAFGRIVAVHNYGAGDIIEVKITGHSGSELVPFTNQYVPDVDIKIGRARVLLPASTEGEPAPGIEPQGHEDGE